MKNAISTINWEETMKATEENAKVAARMTERAVAALAETLDSQRRLSQQMSGLERAVAEIRTRPIPAPASSRPSLPQPRPQGLHLLPLIAAFVAGAACAGFFASW